MISLGCLNRFVEELNFISFCWPWTLLNEFNFNVIIDCK